MYVVKRDGRREPVHYDKITERIRRLCWGLHESVDPAEIAQAVSQGVYKGVTTRELDELAAHVAIARALEHPDFSQLAARISISNLHKETEKSFVKVCRRLHNHRDPRTGKPVSLIESDLMYIIDDNADTLDSHIVHSRDHLFDYFGFKTLQKSYLLQIDNQIVERPQHMFMRVAVSIHRHDIPLALRVYELMSWGYYTHASPTLFNSGKSEAGLSSCFLMSMNDDSIRGIYKTLSDCAAISQKAGGIGIHIHNVRGAQSRIHSTNGLTSGIVPMLRVFNNTARYVDQGGSRKGAVAIYVEPWHSDILEFLDLKKNNGVEECRARDLFYALWVPDLFMQRVAQDDMWSLMSPDECPGLADVFGKDFTQLYTQYEGGNRYRRRLPARDVWRAILEAQFETGTPYMLYKDHINNKNNQSNLGTIKSSNLCAEICEYSSPEETAVCNLCSIALPRFVRHAPLADSSQLNLGEPRLVHLGRGDFDLAALHTVVKMATLSLNRVIDQCGYAVSEAKHSNHLHRPLGIGVQGLADVFFMLALPYDSPEARQLNRLIFETMYHAALEASMELAQQDGPYESFRGSPASQGVLQYHMWHAEPLIWNWSKLVTDIQTHGLRNSLLIALMPTASTSQILGNTESFEPVTSNIYLRHTHAGEFAVVNKFLVAELDSENLWTPQIRQQLLGANGSVQDLDIPEGLKQIYRTVWEIKSKSLVEMAADRAPYIDQSQSFNCYMSAPNPNRLTSYHFGTWRAGLKTGMYYLRTQAAFEAQKATLPPQCAVDCINCGS
jgi:ribonucleoside-diphosphate reductase alpha subunit